MSKVAARFDVADAARQVREAGPALGLALSEPVIEQLVSYLALMHRWNRTYNLTAIREPEQMVTHHLLDSLAVVAPLESALGGAKPRVVVDIGTGGGLPGLVLAILWRDVPVSLVEPVDKKCAFLRQCVGELKLKNVMVISDRVQNLSDKQFAESDSENEAKSEIPGIFICRAYTRLAEFAQQVSPLMQRGDWVAAMKSAQVSEEVSEFADLLKTNSQLITNPANSCQLSMIETKELSVPGVQAARSLVFLRALPHRPTD
jgi:16S rRNA (guanine527-N7)-methyltransferase